MSEKSTDRRNNINPWFVGRVALLSATMGAIAMLLLVLALESGGRASIVSRSKLSTGLSRVRSPISAEKNSRKPASQSPGSEGDRLETTPTIAPTSPRENASDPSPTRSRVRDERIAPANPVSRRNIEGFVARSIPNKSATEIANTDPTKDNAIPEENPASQLPHFQETVPPETSEPIETPPAAEDLLPEEAVEDAIEENTVGITLAEAVALALQNNRQLKNAYLDEILSRQELDSEEDKFVPNFTPEISVGVDRDRFGDFTTANDEIDANIGVTVTIPTGGQLGASFGTGSRSRDSLNADLFQLGSLNSNFSINFTQPLLRNAGGEINRADIEIARINRTSSVLSLKSDLIDTIARTIFAYRNLVQAQKALEIQENALEQALRQLEFTRALIEAGRRARVDLIVPETQVANRRVDLVNAQNRLEQTRLDLIRILDIERDVPLVASEIPDPSTIAAPDLDVNTLIDIALENNTTYLQQLASYRVADWNLLLVRDARRPDLSLRVGYNNNLDGLQTESEDWRAELVLRQEFFGDDRRELNVSRSENRLRTLENTLEDRRQDLAIDVQNQVRDIESNFRQLELARRARELSQEQLDNEREKLRLGLEGVTLIEIARFENDLIAAENQELNATISYLNALTRLEQTVGITLERWNVSIDIPPY